jgi:hypothetical protein
VKAITGRKAADKDLLDIYLNDHLAGATVGLEVARRAAAAQQDRAAGAELERLAGEIREDRTALFDIMTELGISVRRLKIRAASMAEKLGRLKFNGRIIRPSPLSGLVEVEMLRLGVEGKAAAWLTLRTLAERDGRLDTGRLDQLISRARRQAEVLEGLRRRMAVEVFAAR